jgi:hypothetical protein
MSQVLDRLSKWSPGGWRRLTPLQRRVLASAIDNAFNSPDQLSLFTNQWLDVPLVDITTDSVFPVMIDRVISWSESSNRLDQLLKALLEAKPDNPLVVDPVKKIRDELPLAAQRVGEDGAVTARPLWLTNAILTVTLISLAGLWLLLVHSLAAALWLLVPFLIIHVIATAMMPQLASSGRRAGELLFTVADHPWTACSLVFLCLALLGFAYPFVGILRVQAAQADAPPAEVTLVERMWPGNTSPKDGPDDRELARFTLTPFATKHRLYLTRPGDRRYFVAKVDDVVAGETPYGPMRRTILTFEPWKRVEPRYPQVLIHPSAALHRDIKKRESVRLVLSIGGKPLPFENYEGEAIWTGTEPLSELHKARYIVTSVKSLSRGQFPLKPKDQLKIELEYKLVQTPTKTVATPSLWKSFPGFPQTVEIGEPGAIQEVKLNAE